MNFYDFGVQCALRDAGFVKQAGLFSPATINEALLPLIRQGRSLGRGLMHEGMHLGEHGLRHKGIAQVGHTLEGGEGGVPEYLAPPNSPAQNQLMLRR